MNLAKQLEISGSLYGAKPLFRFSGVDFAFDEIMCQVSLCAGLFAAAGVRPGDRVLLIAKNRPEWIVTLLATLKIGGIVVPVNPALTTNELAYIAEHSEPSLIVTDQDLLEVVEPCAINGQVLVFPTDGSVHPLSWWDALSQSRSITDFVETADGDAAAIFYTSGTTGRPKGVMQSHASLWSTAQITARTFDIQRQDVSLIPNSLSFIYPMVINGFGCMLAGATIVLQARFHPELAMRAIESERVTIMMGVPTMFAMMLNWLEGNTFDSRFLRLGVSAGSSLAWSIAERFEAKFGAPLFDLWGQTEGTPITSYDPRRDRMGKPDSCGRALDPCRVRVVDEHGSDLAPNVVGEVLLFGPNTMLGYYKNPQATSEVMRDGWVYTGDLGKLDELGYLYIVGRKRDMIIRGGSNIYPVEIEDILYRHAGVLECAVVGVPDELFGEQVKAYVVVKNEHSVLVSDLDASCRANLADYKVPCLFEFVTELPKGPTGKILKRLLK